MQTTSYTVDLMLEGVRDFPAQMGTEAAHSNFAAEARFGLEWLMRMWDQESSTLYYQVGIGSGNRTTAGDHDIWRLPQADDTYGGQDPRYRFIRRRPVFRAGPPGSSISPNLAGRDAAAFALCFQVFHTSDAPFADRCLRAGERIYELADTHPHGHLLTAIPFSFYPEREWRDDLELGASELALALSSGGQLPSGLAHTESAYYLASAGIWAKAYIKHSKRSADPLNLYDVSGLAHFELARALRLAGERTGLAVSEAELVANLRDQLEAATRQAASDPFGFGYPWATADTASHGSGLAVMAAEYEDLTGEADVPRGRGSRWLANVLGANAWGVSLIIGDGTHVPALPPTSGSPTSSARSTDLRRSSQGRSSRGRAMKRAPGKWKACGPALARGQLNSHASTMARCSPTKHSPTPRSSRRSTSRPHPRWRSPGRSRRPRARADERAAVSCSMDLEPACPLPRNAQRVGPCRDSRRSEACEEIGLVCSPAHNRGYVPPNVRTVVRLSRVASVDGGERGTHCRAV